MKKLFILFIFFCSCVKQTEEQVVSEKVDMNLLNQWIGYEMALQAKSLWGKEVTIHMTRNQFDKMIDNFLLNERLCLIENSKHHSAGRPEPNSAPTENDNNGGGVSCTGKFNDYNTISSIVFRADMSVTGSSIIASSFAFGGIGGTWTPIGSIEQTYFDGVVTYKQYYQESYSLPGGVTQNQIYVIYGSIYNNTCTVQGMQVPKN